MSAKSIVHSWRAFDQQVTLTASWNGKLSILRVDAIEQVGQDMVPVEPTMTLTDVGQIWPEHLHFFLAKLGMAISAER